MEMDPSGLLWLLTAMGSQAPGGQLLGPGKGVVGWARSSSGDQPRASQLRSVTQSPHLGCILQRPRDRVGLGAGQGGNSLFTRPYAALLALLIFTATPEAPNLPHFGGVRA